MYVMDKQTRISRLVRQFLGDRFSASTEERVQRWLIENRDDEEKNAASLDFWESLADAPTFLSRHSWLRVTAKAGIPTVKKVALVRRWASIAAAIAIPLMAVAGSLIYYAEVVRPKQETARVTAEKATVTEVVANDPLIFEGASVEEILGILERRFNVSITANEEFYHTGELYTVKFTRNESLDDILAILKEVIGEFEYTKTGNNILIISK